MSDRSDDIRTTAEQLDADAERLQAIEQQKLELADDDERVVALSLEALRLTEAMAKTAKIQLAVAVDPSA